MPRAGGEVAAADLLGQRLGEDGGRLLAIGLDQRAHRREQGGMGERIGIEPVLARLGEGVLDLAVGDVPGVLDVFGEGRVEWQVVGESGHEGSSTRRREEPVGRKGRVWTATIPLICLPRIRAAAGGRHHGL